MRLSSNRSMMIDDAMQSPKLSWNTHSIVTRAALDSIKAPQINEEIPVVRLEDFLSCAHVELRELARRHIELLSRKNGQTLTSNPIPSRILTVEDFLVAFRLNPCRPIFYVKVLRPEKVPWDSPHDACRSGPPGGTYIPNVEAERIIALEILVTFSDEPDWGMDQDLFDIEDYEYGQPPFGDRTGKSSQAPFHMAFLQDNLLLLKILPRLRKSFMKERISIFLALAGLALQKEIYYWGWRFTAWAMHYLQDLTQPYHAHPFPPSLLRIPGILIMNRSRHGVVRGIGNYLKNRHILCEAAVHFLLNEAVKKRLDHPFLKVLSSPEGSLGGSLGALMKESARIAGSLARRTDKTLVGLFNDPRINDGDYSVGDDFSYPLERSLEEAAQERPALFNEFLEIITMCLIQTGSVTRYAVDLALKRRTDPEVSSLMHTTSP